MGANVLVQGGGGCRYGYYGELQEKILRDLGYDFEFYNLIYDNHISLKKGYKFCKKMNIKCPNCGQLIALEQNVYDSIANDVRNEQFEKELEKRAASLSREKESAVQLAVSKAQNEKEKEIAALEAKLSKIAAEFEAEKQILFLKNLLMYSYCFLSRLIDFDHGSLDLRCRAALSL